MRGYNRFAFAAMVLTVFSAGSSFAGDVDAGVDTAAALGVPVMADSAQGPLPAPKSAAPPMPPGMYIINR